MNHTLLFEWGRYKLVNGIQWPSISQFSIFLDQHADLAHTVMTQNETSDSKILQCYLCKGAHAIWKCNTFTKMTLEDRRKWARNNQRCFTCLGDHMQENCKLKDNPKKKCGIDGCTATHLRLLHSSENNKNNKKTTTEVSLHTNSGASSKVLFRVIPVKLYGKGNKVISTHAFIDDGSSITMIDKLIADELGLDGKCQDLCMKWTGETFKTEKNSKQVDVVISGIGDKHKKFTMNKVQTMNNLALPKQTICSETLKKKYPFLNDVEFNSMNDAVPTVLIGLKQQKLGLPYEIRQGKWHEPVAARTKLGWVVFGPDQSANDEECNFHVCVFRKLIKKWILFLKSFLMMNYWTTKLDHKFNLKKTKEQMKLCKKR